MDARGGVCDRHNQYVPAGERCRWCGNSAQRTNAVQDWSLVGACPIGKHRASQSHKCILCGASGEQIIAQAFACP